MPSNDDLGFAREPPAATVKLYETSFPSSLLDYNVSAIQTTANEGDTHLKTFASFNSTA